MKDIPHLVSRRALLGIGGLALAPRLAQAQAPAAAPKEILVDVDKVSIDIQKTPDFNVPNVTPKRFIPKDWIEIEVDCQAKLSKNATDKDQKAYDEVTFQYYAYLSGNADAKKNRVLTGEVVHVNVPIGEKIHSVVYISPRTILKITEKPGPATKALIRAWGVAVFIKGTEVGRRTSDGNKEWWNDARLPQKEAALLDKSKTPFAPLWGDYHLDVRAK
jgi:hypothetical protein